MLKLYHAPLTRSVRIYWLLEELGLPYELVTVPFEVPESAFSQPTPTGKFPTLEDGEVVMFESGAILEYVVDRYGKGRLGPPPDSAQRAAYLQWIHFSESTAFIGLGNLAWHTMNKKDADNITASLADYRGWAVSALDVLDAALDGKRHLLGDGFSAADVMMGYTVKTASFFGVLGDAHPNVGAYLARLEERPAFQKALSPA